MFRDFDGGYKIKEMQLKNFDWNDVLNDIGVYVVVSEEVNMDSFLFLKNGSGGYFKNRNPNTSLEELNNNWVKFENNDERILYIGKAGGNNKSNLKKRIKQYIRFGQGDLIGHWGGRYIWQLRGVGSLFIYWKKCDNPRDEERRLLQEFKDRYNKLPFANLKA